jgi:hypothetical protein
MAECQCESLNRGRGREGETGCDVIEEKKRRKEKGELSDTFYLEWGAEDL